MVTHYITFFFFYPFLYNTSEKNMVNHIFIIYENHYHYLCSLSSHYDFNTFLIISLLCFTEEIKPYWFKKWHEGELNFHFWINYFFIITPSTPFFSASLFFSSSAGSLQRVSTKLAAIAHLSSCFIQVRWSHAERCRWEELIRITLMFDERRKTRDYGENEWGSLINAERV